MAAFHEHPDVDEVIAVLPASIATAPPEWLDTRATVVEGGTTRAESVVNGVRAASATAAVLLIHDGVRPFVSSETISTVARAARSGPVIPVVGVVDTIKTVGPGGEVTGSPARDGLRAAQTPQGFPANVLRTLHESVEPGADVTDDGVMCERAGIRVDTVEGDPRNLKITDPADLEYARWLVETGVIEPPNLG